MTALNWCARCRPHDIISVDPLQRPGRNPRPRGKLLDQEEIETRIQVMQASGGTEIYQGLEAGMAEVMRYRSNNHINHLILITDGRTYGDEEDCLRLVGLATSQGIGISSLGIGSQWNDRFLDQRPRARAATANCIAKAEDIRQFLHEKVIRLGHSYASTSATRSKPAPGLRSPTHFA